MHCIQCGKKVDEGKLIRGKGLLCGMCFIWLGVNEKKRKGNFSPDWNQKLDFLSDLLILLEGI